MKSIPCYRSAHLMPYLEFMEKCGVATEKRLLQAGLPSQIDGEANLYLPQLPTLTFLRKVQHDEGIDEMPYRALQHLRFTDLDEQFVSKALQSPTLFSALKTFAEDVIIEDPDVRFWIEYDENNVRLCMTNHLPFEPESLRFEDWNELLVLVAIVQAFVGSRWLPKEMAFRSNLPLSPYISEQYPDTRLIIGQSANWLTLPRHLLSSPPLKSGKQYTPNSLFNTFDKPIVSSNKIEPFIESLKQILPAYFKDGYPSVQLAASIAGISTRTLQRKLALNGYNYTDLIKKMRFEVATELLSHTNTNITEIAFQLGYEDSTHFSRAFRSLAGSSPREYRNDCH